jgi:hypothetical protein
MRGFSKYSNNFWVPQGDTIWILNSCSDTLSSFSKTKFACTHVEKEEQKEGAQFVTFRNNLL